MFESTFQQQQNASKSGFQAQVSLKLEISLSIPLPIRVVNGLNLKVYITFNRQTTKHSYVT